MRRRTQKKSRKVKGGACGSCMMQPQVQSGGKCPCAAASKLPIIFGGVRLRKNGLNKQNRKNTQKRVRFA